MNLEGISGDPVPLKAGSTATGYLGPFPVEFGMSPRTDSTASLDYPFLCLTTFFQYPLSLYIAATSCVSHLIATAVAVSL